MESGHCATCDSRVKWPKGVFEFRCSICLMVNDLKPVTSSLQEPSQHFLSRPIERTRAIIDRCIDEYLEISRQSRGKLREPGSATPPSSPPALPWSPTWSPRSPQKPLPDASPVTDPASTPHDESYFSADRLRTQASFSPASPPHEHHLHPPRSPAAARANSPGAHAGFNITRKPVAAHGITFPSRPARTPPPPPPPPASNLAKGSKPLPSAPHGTRLPNELELTPNSRFDAEKQPLKFVPASRIFRPLEDFLAHSFGEQGCLNKAFARPRRIDQHGGHHEPSTKSRRDEPPRQARAGPDATLSELDAKTLLLGDVAENGLWWTGRDGFPSPEDRQQRSKPKAVERQKTLVQPKSPGINWAEVDTWYNTVLNAGKEWQKRPKARQIVDQIALSQIDQAVSAAIAEGRAHVHNTLLKISETLLKRPGQPIKEPGDLRFLLILLANPLLYPNFGGVSTRDAGLPKLASPQARLPTNNHANGSGYPEHSDSHLAGPRSAWDQGNAFGIIKRILGLLSHSPGGCHRHLLAWFARYDETRFRNLVDIVDRFLTHRLKRQHGRKKSNHLANPTAGLIPDLSGTSADTSAQLHAALGLGPQGKVGQDKNTQHSSYSDDWQVKAAARVMSLLFSANKVYQGNRNASNLNAKAEVLEPGSSSRSQVQSQCQLVATSEFYNTMVDMSDLITDFDVWESSKGRFAFCQYPFFLSVRSKIRIMDHDAKRQMAVKAREAFFDSILKNKALEQNLTLRVRRDCLAQDSLSAISEVVGAGQEEIKKSLKVQFVGEEGIDAGGLRKEWFLLLAREIFDPHHALFIYDEDSHLCYFNPYSFETSDQFFLVGSLLGLAIYNSTILDVALPPFTFKKLLMSGPASAFVKHPQNRPAIQYTLADLAQYRPALAHGLGQLLKYDGDVQETFCRDFVIEVDRYGRTERVPLCDGGAKRPVTNENRAEFVDLYIRYLLDVQVSRQFEPFKRGFFTVCGGNALSLFQPEEIELLVRGSDEALDVTSLKAVAVYENWKGEDGKAISSPSEAVPLLAWFWAIFEEASPEDQRKVLSFITSSDRIPAVGATSLVIKIAYAGPDGTRFPIARTCFNQILLWGYKSRDELESRLWRAIRESEGFGLR